MYQTTSLTAQLTGEYTTTSIAHQEGAHIVSTESKQAASRLAFNIHGGWQDVLLQYLHERNVVGEARPRKKGPEAGFITPSTTTRPLLRCPSTSPKEGTRTLVIGKQTRQEETHSCKRWQCVNHRCGAWNRMTRQVSVLFLPFPPPSSPLFRSSSRSLLPSS